MCVGYVQTPHHFIEGTWAFEGFWHPKEPISMNTKRTIIEEDYSQLETSTVSGDFHSQWRLPSQWPTAFLESLQQPCLNIKLPPSLEDEGANGSSGIAQLVLPLRLCGTGIKSNSLYGTFQRSAPWVRGSSWYITEQLNSISFFRWNNSLAVNISPANPANGPWALLCRRCAAGQSMPPLQQQYFN